MERRQYMQLRSRAPATYPMPAPFDPRAHEAPPPPPGTVFLQRGGGGAAYIARNGMAVYKVDETDEATAREFETLRALAHLAPDYLPAPVQLVRLGARARLAIQMMNAGESLGRLTRTLSPPEVAVCLLQAIHFALLLGDAYATADVYWRNLCVRGQGPEGIQLRWIDVEQWRPAATPAPKGEVLRANAVQFLTVLRDHSTDPELRALVSRFLPDDDDDPLLLPELATALMDRYELHALQRGRALLAQIQRALAPPPPAEPVSYLPMLDPGARYPSVEGATAAEVHYRRKRLRVAPAFFPEPPDENPLAEVPLPPDTLFLGEGAHGCALIAAVGQPVVYKFSMTYEDDQIADEFRRLSAAIRLAPQYLPAPAQLTYLRIGDRRMLAIQMTNAGQTLSAVWPLTAVELGLCLLQSVHFVLLLGDRCLVEDAGGRNVCARGRGTTIQLRWIDAGLWEVFDTDDDDRVLALNAQRCVTGAWARHAAERPEPLFARAIAPLLQGSAALRTRAELWALGAALYHLLRAELPEGPEALPIAQRLCTLYDELSAVAPAP